MRTLPCPTSRCLASATRTCTSLAIITGSTPWFLWEAWVQEKT